MTYLETEVTIESEEDLGKYSDEEICAYVERGRSLYGNRLKGITLKSVPDDPDMVDIYYDIKNTPFSRLRRITGYLVGDMNRWNNAKRKEEGDRLKHDYI